MSEDLTLDEDLVRRLPLPLAQMYRRAFNAKSSKDRHDAALSLFEASVKLLACVAVGEFCQRANPDERLVKMLQNLVRPSLGHWWEIGRRILPALADQGDETFQHVRNVILGRKRDDMPFAAGLNAKLRNFLEGKENVSPTVSIGDLFSRLVTYRNRLAHGAQLARGGFEDMGRPMLLGLSEILAKINLLAGRRLMLVAEVHQSAGSWLVHRYELIGENRRRIQAIKVARDEATGLPDAGHVYLVDPGAENCPGRFVPLYPLVAYNESREEFLFYNYRAGRDQSAYLCYATGTQLKLTDEAAQVSPLITQALGFSSPDGKPPSPSEFLDPSQPLSVLGQVPGVRPIGEFELISEIGRGAMGIVYRAWQPSLGRMVALKKLTHTGADAVARFTREIRALGRVEHPNLVKVFVGGTDGDQYFFAMELIEGTTLGTVGEWLRVRNGNVVDIDMSTWEQILDLACKQTKAAETILDPVAAERWKQRDSGSDSALSGKVPALGHNYVRQILELMAQAADASHALHEAGVVHGDIKPGNLMLSADGRKLVLMDLGLAQLADTLTDAVKPGADRGAVAALSLADTLRYASPEQVVGSRELTRRSDVYSLGATFWEFLTLRTLFGADRQTPPKELIDHIQFQKPERLQTYHPGISRDIEAVISMCLEKNPAARYSTARDLARDLRHILAGEPVKARPMSHLEFGWRMMRQRVTEAGFVTAGVTAVVALGMYGVAEFRGYRLEAKNAEIAARLGVRDLEFEELQRQSQRVVAALTESSASINRYFGEIEGRERTTNVRRQLDKARLNIAKTFISFLEPWKDQPDIRAQLVKAYTEVGQVTRPHNRRLALDAFETAFQQYQALSKDTDESAAPVRNLAKDLILIHVRRAALYTEANNLPLARAALTDAGRAIQQLKSRQQGTTPDPEIPLLESELDHHKGQYYAEKGLFGRARGCGEAALKTRQILLDQALAREKAGWLPSDRSNRLKYDLALTATLLGDVFARTGDLGKAKEMYTQAYIPLKELSDTGQDLTDYANQFARAKVNLARVSGTPDRPEPDPRKEYDEALAIQEKLVRPTSEVADVIDYRSDLAWTLVQSVEAMIMPDARPATKDQEREWLARLDRAKELVDDEMERSSGESGLKELEIRKRLAVTRAVVLRTSDPEKAAAWLRKAVGIQESLMKGRGLFVDVLALASLRIRTAELLARGDTKPGASPDPYYYDLAMEDLERGNQECRSVDAYSLKTLDTSPRYQVLRKDDRFRERFKKLTEALKLKSEAGAAEPDL